MSLVIHCDLEVFDAGHVQCWLDSHTKTRHHIYEVLAAGRQIDDQALTVLIPALLQRCPRTRRIDLSGNLITDQGCVFLAEHIGTLRSQLPGGDGLRTLVLSGNQIGQTGVEALAEKFFPENGSGEYALALSENQIGDQGVEALAAGLDTCKCSTSLLLCNVGCGSRGCDALRRSMRWISALDISYNSDIPVASLAGLSAALGPNLRRLGFSHLCSGGFSHASFRGTASEALAAALQRCDALCTLNLAGNHLQDAGLKQLSDAFAAGAAPALEDLDMAANRIRDGNLLAQLLGNGRQQLSRLGLEANELNDLAMVAVSAGVSLSSSLRSLNLARNRFGDEGVEALAHVLLNQRRKRRTEAPGLDLSPEELVSWVLKAGVADTASLGATSESGIRRLDLSFNMVTDVGALALAHAMQDVANLEPTGILLINLYGSSIGTSGREALEGAVRASYVGVEEFANTACSMLASGELHPVQFLPWILQVQGLGFKDLESGFAARAQIWAKQLPARFALAEASAGKHRLDVKSADTLVVAADDAPPDYIKVDATDIRVLEVKNSGDLQEPEEEASAADTSKDSEGGHKTPPPKAGPVSRTEAALERAREALKKKKDTIANSEVAVGVSSASQLPTATISQSQPPQSASQNNVHLGVDAAPSATQHAFQPNTRPAIPVAASLARAASPSGSPTQAAAARAGGSVADVLNRARNLLQRAHAPQPSMAQNKLHDSTPAIADVKAANTPSPVSPGNPMPQPEHLSHVSPEAPPELLLETLPEAPEVVLEAAKAPPQVVQLEREVAELRHAVMRIDRTVSYLNPEPENEADIADLAAAPSATDAVPTPDSCSGARATLHWERRIIPTPDSCSGARADSCSIPVPENEADSAAHVAQTEPLSQRRPSNSGTGSRRPSGGNPPGPAPPPKQKAVGPPPPAKRGIPPKPPPKGKGAGKGGVASKAVEEGPFHRKLYWKPIDLQGQEDTLFSSEDGRPRSKTTELDVDALKRMFVNEAASGHASRRRSLAVLSRVNQKATGIKLLSDHRARNIAIVLKRLPVSTKELAKILRQLKWEAPRITSDDLEQILEIIPTQEETEKLCQHMSAEQMEQLRDVERLVFPLAMLKRGAARVRLLVIARSAKAQFGSTASAFAKIRSACHAIHSSAMLREVMLLALDLGNFINHGDSKRGAKAISIGSLLTLRDFKAGQVSTLHFLCASLHRAEPSRNAAQVLSRELRPVTVASKLQVQTIQFEMRKFNRDLEIITSECTNFAEEYGRRRSCGDSNGSIGEDRDVQEDDEENSEDGDSGGEEAAELAAAATMEAAVPHSAAASWTEAEDLGADDATRFVEDVMKIRGSALRRLRCMRSVVEKLNRLLNADMERTVEQVKATLKFCGMSTPASQATKEVPNDLEPLLQQLGDFLQVFTRHWEEVTSNLPLYQQFFGEAS